MEYAKIPGLATTLPRFHESFPSPSHTKDQYSASTTSSTSSSPYLAPLSTYNNSTMDSHTHSHPATSLKREHFDLDSAFLQEQHDSYDYGYPLSKRPFASSRGGIRLPALFSSRQRQESGCSISSTSSWSSSASFSSVSTLSSTGSFSHSFGHREETPPPNKRARKEQQQQLQQRYLQRSSGKSDQHLTKSPLASPPSPLDAQSPKSTLDDLLTAIALDNKLIQELEGVATKFKGVAHPDEEIRSARRAQTPATVSSQDSSEDEAESEPRQPHDPHALRVLFLAPNWLENHMAKAKRLAAMQEQQQ